MKMLGSDRPQTRELPNGLFTPSYECVPGFGGQLERDE